MTERFDLRCFGYATNRISWHRKSCIPDLSDVFRTLTVELSELSSRYDEITLVGHSQGGLVIQGYLVAQLKSNKGHDLAKIRNVVFIATPNLGSDYLSLFRRAYYKVFPNPQEAALRIFNEEISAMRAVLREKVVGANRKGNDAWPIPIQCFWGRQDEVVKPASAKEPFDNVMPLDGNHYTVIEPSNHVDERYRQLVDAFFEPLGHRHIHEIDCFEQVIRVKPLAKETTFSVRHGAHTRFVNTDNVARVKRTITYSRKNTCKDPFVLRYGTRNDGYIKATFSGPNDASAAELQTASDRSTVAFFKFTPNPGETFYMHATVYKGFDKGHRNVHFHLNTGGDSCAYYKKLRVCLDLSAYLRAGWSAIDIPKLYYHERDLQHDQMCWRRELDAPFSQRQHDGRGRFVWEFERVRGGVIDVMWDVTPPKGKGTNGEEEVSREATLEPLV